MCGRRFGGDREVHSPCAPIGASGGRVSAIGRPGGDLLSHVLRRSTIGAEGFHGRVRDGIGCRPLAMTTRSASRTDLPTPLASGDRSPWAPGVGSLLNGNRDALLGRKLLFGAHGVHGMIHTRGRCLFESDQTERAISTGQLRALLPFHTQPIDVMVYHGSSGSAGFEGDFPLRCFQRLFRPHLATRLCCWRNNRSTRGASIPVLSY